MSRRRSRGVLAPSAANSLRLVVARSPQRDADKPRFDLKDFVITIPVEFARKPNVALVRVTVSGVSRSPASIGGGDAARHQDDCRIRSGCCTLGFIARTVGARLRGGETANNG